MEQYKIKNLPGFQHSITNERLPWLEIGQYIEFDEKDLDLAKILKKQGTNRGWVMQIEHAKDRYWLIRTLNKLF